MTTELIKQMMDACYLAKRAGHAACAAGRRDASYIQYLDTIQKLQTQGLRVKVSDLSDALGLPRPGVTRTVKEMEAKGYLKKEVSSEDGRVTYLSLSEEGKQLSRKYDADYFRELAPYLDCISEEDARCMIATIEKFHQIMCERRNAFENR